MASFTKWLLDHKVAVICVLVLLMALSVVGTILTDKESDVLSYLDPESDTSIGKQMLNEQYGIVGDTTIGISYLSREDIQRIVTFVDGTASDGAYDGMDENDIPTQSRAFSKTVEGKPLLSRNVVWIGSFDDLDALQGGFDTFYFIYGSSSIPVAQPDLNMSLETLQQRLQDKFVKETDGETTYILNIYFSQSGSNNAVINALDALEKEIQRILNERIEDGTITQIDDASQGYYFSGMAQNARILVDSSLNDMPKFVIAAVLVVFVILLLSSHSYLEPFIFLATLGISILLNMGTNVIAGNPIGTISTITSSCAVILQLAVAMDYSIFLSHSFQEELRTLKDPKIALMHAMPKTLKSILASALTTVGGFVALFFMNYGIGYDLGFVLAKGVILSLLAVIFIQPILLILTKKLIDKTHHNWIVTPRLNFVGKTITNKWVSVIVIVLCVAIAVPSAYFQGLVPLNYITFTNETPEEEKSLAQREVEGTNNQLILVIPYQYDGYGNIDLSKHYEFIDKIQQVGVTDETAPSNDFVEGDYVREDGNKFNPVSDVFTLASLFDSNLMTAVQNQKFLDFAGALMDVEAQLKAQLFGSFISNVDDETEGSVHYMLYTINLEGDPEDIESYNTMLRIRDIANEMFDTDAAGKHVYVTGLAQGAYDLFTVTPDDFTLVNILSAVIVFLVLLLTFRRPIMSVVLLLVIEAGIFANLTLAYLIGDKINFMAYLIVSAIELGATVDYAILFSSKYFEEKENCTGVVAVKNAVHRSAPSVITSASILIFTCVAVTLLTTNPIVGQITRLIAIGTCFSLILVFTLLPSILNIKERVSRWYSIKKGKGDPDEGKDNVPIYEKKRQAKLEAKKLAMASVGADGDSVMIDADAGDGVKASDVLIDRGDEPKPAETGDGGDADDKAADDKADDEVMTTSDDDKK